MSLVRDTRRKEEENVEQEEATILLEDETPCEHLIFDDSVIQAKYMLSGFLAA